MFREQYPIQFTSTVFSKTIYEEVITRYLQVQAEQLYIDNNR
jgi:hypothetical protein